METSLDGCVIISIHAPREGGDFHDALDDCRACGISIHAPREGGDSSAASTTTSSSYFNPRPPRGGRQAPPTG